MVPVHTRAPAELLKIALTETTPLHLNREWCHFLKCGGHPCKNKPGPLAAKTVRKHRWCGLLGLLGRDQMSLVAVNPVTNSEPPRPKKHLAIALPPKA
jgi:hypothetical protein